MVNWLYADSVHCTVFIFTGVFHGLHVFEHNDVMSDRVKIHIFQGFLGAEILLPIILAKCFTSKCTNAK